MSEHKCPVCHKKFRSFFSLKIHFKRAHEDINVCPVCHRKFDSYTGFVIHLRSARDSNHRLLKALAQKTKYLSHPSVDQR